MHQARTLAQAFQHIASLREQTLECDLANIESLAIREAKVEDDANADTHVDLAMYWSMVAVADEGTPCFKASLSRNSFAQDAQGTFVPADIVEAERMLLWAEQHTFEDLLPAVAVKRASRLYQHANHLAMQHHDAGAEWRYRAAASHAAEHGESRLAAHSLARLGTMLMLRNRRQEALVAADAALTHTEDPLALYLQVSLRLRAGGFQTSDAVHAAVKQLQALAGQLPWKALEAERTALEADLALWDAVAEGSVSKCLWLHDAAKVLICMLCRFAL
jgi:hypothetical protein